MKYLYKYPQREFPVRRPGRDQPRGARARSSSTSCSTPASSTTTATSTCSSSTPRPARTTSPIRCTVHNRGPEAARLHVLPTLWFRNTWSWDDGTRRSRCCASTQRRDRRVASRAGQLHPRVRGRARAAVHRERDQRRAALGAAESDALREGRLPPVRVGGERDAVNPARHRHQGRRALRARRAGRRQPGRFGCGCAPNGDGEAFGDGLRRRVPAAHRGGRRVLRPHHRRVRSARTSGASTGRRSPACCGPSSTTTSTSTAG